MAKITMPMRFDSEYSLQGLRNLKYLRKELNHPCLKEVNSDKIGCTYETLFDKKKNKKITN
jgi:hypothetical protein